MNTLRTVEQPTSVLIGQPANYPARLVDGLAALFAHQRDVTAGYLAQIFEPSHDHQPVECRVQLTRLIAVG